MLADPMHGDVDRTDKAVCAPSVVPPGSRSFAPLFVADWTDALFLHYEIEPRRLQPFVPFALELWHGRAFISLVAFTMRGMRFARGGAPGAALCRPIATHEFLNLRTYVRHGGEAGICFLAEWLPNWMSVLCGPLFYALPYRHAKIRYQREAAKLRGTITTRHGQFRYEGTLHKDKLQPSAPGSLDEFLLERYSAFNAGSSNHARRMFQVRHAPWPQCRADVRVLDDSLLRRFAPWWSHAGFAGANFSPGVLQVGMGAPRRLRAQMMAGCARVHA